MSNPYTDAIAAAVAEDGTRSSWTPAQWRAYWLADVAGKQPARITSTVVMRLFGPTRGSAIMAIVKTAAPEVYSLMAPSEQGLDVSHADTATFLAGLVAAGVTQSEVDAVLALADVTAPRHSVAGLPDPKERWFA